MFQYVSPFGGEFPGLTRARNALDQLASGFNAFHASDNLLMIFTKNRGEIKSSCGSILSSRGNNTKYCRSISSCRSIISARQDASACSMPAAAAAAAAATDASERIMISTAWQSLLFEMLDRCGGGGPAPPTAAIVAVS
uniref:Uncharacterized protein n=1 Tax=Anopheles culicifacies TaxID=139723 RepID=A0A182MJL4_9DIPT